MGVTSWNGIQNLVDSGLVVRGKLDNSFFNIDTKFDAIDDSIASIESDILDVQNSVGKYGALIKKTTTSLSLTTTPQNMANYATALNGSDITCDAVAGSIALSTTGAYEISLFMSTEFTSVSTTREVLFQLFNATTNLVEAEAPMNIPRDSIRDSKTLSTIFTVGTPSAFILRIASSVAMTLDLAYISFSVKKIG
jgi:hypothetical protein